MLIRITIRSNIIAGAIFKILSRSFYAEILALQGFTAGLRASYFIRDKSGYSEIQDNQTFSIAGSRKGFGDPRGTLFFELARLAEARKPSYLLFENVPGLLSHDGGRTFATILNTLDRLGYGVEWQCLNSKDFGVPQSRNRVYIVGYLDERCRGKVFPFTETAGSSLIQTHGGHQGERVYSPEGLSCTLAANPGGFGGKTGLYEVGVPIKCATKTGYQLAQVGDSIDLSYATVNSRRGRVGKQIAHTLTTGCQQGKVGYVWLTIGVNPLYVDTGIRIESAADLCGRCLDDVATDVLYMTGNDHALEAADPLELAEIKRRWEPYINQLPEYAYICDDLLSGRK